MVSGLNNTWSCNDGQIATTICDIVDIYSFTHYDLPFKCLTEAFINSLKRGWALLTRLFNSGWNWPATYQGWSGNSTISTKFSSEFTPEIFRPFFSNRPRYRLFTSQRWRWRSDIFFLRYAANAFVPGISRRVRVGVNEETAGCVGIVHPR